MMRFLTRRKKKEKIDADLYEPPTVAGFANDVSAPTSQSQPTQQQQPHQQQQQQPHNPAPSETGSNPLSDHSAGYRFALNAYAETIPAAFSNEDGFGGGGGTLRSRSGRLRGSGGKKHRTLIPILEPPSTPNSEASGYGVEMDRYSFMNNEHQQQRVFFPEGTFDAMSAEGTFDAEAEHWAPIPEEPHSPGRASLDENGDEEPNVGQEQVIGQSSSEASGQTERVSSSRSEASSNINFQNASVAYVPLDANSIETLTSPANSSLHSNLSRIKSQQSPQSVMNYRYRLSTIKEHKSSNSSDDLNLQPDAIYEEHYGDAYVDQLIKYLYPSGYQSMRPRSGPWKLSILICLLFMWLSVFIVGHCYDRGQEYNSYFGHADDAYLQEVDDDTLVMETRWCGSKLVYFMWFVCVSITMLAMSYCSIIGYIKLRDVAVANGRSQPMGVMTDAIGRSDCYANIENVNTTNGGWENRNGEDKESSCSASTGYSSYQGGSGGRRYPSIYQSDGTPQFWGGHIYRPMQAAVAMTNR
ncbi:hypothetical protein HJC23_000656 [Cyclotella cryptica]|uniref:Uncharacterized protein n=1 Tax=Cyclotella cryptica TaxID=29204 RepID=A0ABD3Q7N2_9STRA